MSKKVVVIGAGFGGCGAAASAARAGAEVTLVEKTDMLTGVGLLAGSFARDGGFPAHEELKAMGAGDIPRALESEIIHTTVKPEPAFTRDCRKGGKAVEKVLNELGVKIIYRGLASDIEMSGKEVGVVKLKDSTRLEADAVVDTTGGAGPIKLCEEYGKGCVGCVMRCYLFGGRISIAAKAGVKDYAELRAVGETFGAYTSAVSLYMESLSPELQRKLKKTCDVEIPTPEELIEPMYRRLIETGRMNHPYETAYKIRLRDVGYVDVRQIAYIKREELEKIPGLENAIYAQPQSGWIGNAVRFLAASPRDNTLKAEGVENLFVAGEKAGNLSGITAAYMTGALAGHNAARKAAGMELLELPRTTVIGEVIAYSGERQVERGVGGGFELKRLKELGLYITDVQEIHRRIEKLGLSGIFSKKLV